MEYSEMISRFLKKSITSIDIEDDRKIKHIYSSKERIIFKNGYIVNIKYREDLGLYDIFVCNYDLEIDKYILQNFNCDSYGHVCTNDINIIQSVLEYIEQK